MTLEFHPLANLFPLIEGRDLDELAADIKANGLLEPIIILDGKILDGRNRYRAAVAAGVFDPDHDCHLFDGADDALKWVLSKNLHRRHLSASQRAAVAAEIGKLSVGRPSEWDKTPAEGNGKPANLPDSSHLERTAPALTQAERAGVLGISERQVRTGDFVREHAAPEVFDAVKRGEVAVSAAAEVARLPVAEQLDVLRTARPQDLARAARDRINGARAVMADRREPDDSLDYFPTPPWATRALIETVGLPVFGRRVWEPACGEGHMSGVLLEYGASVVATDVFDYSVDGRAAPGWDQRVDFLSEVAAGAQADWIITNPPFGERLLPFILKALDRATDGVAMFVRAQCLEGIDRHERLFAVRPPTLIAQFAERVPLHKGRWEPDGDTATMYCWLVWQRGWLKGKPDGLQTKFRWIPPGRRAALTRSDDVERFTARPVLAPQALHQSHANADDDAEAQGADAESVSRLAVGRTTAAGEDVPSASPAPLPVDLYAAALAVALATTPVGSFGKATAEPVLRAAYAADPVIPTRQVGADLGAPIGSVLGWASRLGLTKAERRGGPNHIGARRPETGGQS